MKNTRLSLPKQLLFRGLFRALCIYYFVRRPLTLGVQALVWDEQDRVLLVKHSYQPGWRLPGGHVEKGETVYQAIERELFEELKLECPRETLTLKGVYYCRGDHKHDHVVLFEIKNYKGAPIRLESDEIEEAGFFEEVPPGTWWGTRRRIEECGGAVPLSDRW